MGERSVRVIAVDWSGAKGGGAQKIWVAEVVEGRLQCLRNGRTRSEVVEYLIQEAEADPHMVVGLDFAFSFPEWFVRDCSVSCGPEMWGVVERKGEDWLATCESPFWGRAGTTRPELLAHFRATEAHVRDACDAQAKSVFHVSGGGVVGTASIRGMPHLKCLADAGFHVWPFESAALPLVVEIYPRVLTGPVDKSKASMRRKHVNDRFDVTREQLNAVTDSDDAFDAAVSALVMAKQAEDLLKLPNVTESQVLAEGWIWMPGDAAAHQTG